MPLAKKTLESEEFIPCKEIVSANRNAEDAFGCGELTGDSEGLASSCHSIHENVTPENAEDVNNSNEDEPHDDDFWPKDPLRFTWQIARGMVNNVVIFFLLSLERLLIICIRY